MRGCSAGVRGARLVADSRRAARQATLVPWLAYQRRVAGDDEIAAWFARWRRLVREGVVEGERNNTLASLTGHLLWHGVDPEVALELLLAWNRARCRPPLPDDEVARVVASIARLHERQAGADR